MMFKFFPIIFAKSEVKQLQTVRIQEKQLSVICYFLLIIEVSQIFIFISNIVFIILQGQASQLHEVLLHLLRNAIV